MKKKEILNLHEVSKKDYIKKQKEIIRYEKMIYKKIEEFK